MTTALLGMRIKARNAADTGGHQTPLRRQTFPTFCSIGVVVDVGQTYVVVVEVTSGRLVKCLSLNIKQIYV